MKASEILEMCQNMIKIFGLGTGDNKRKVSAAFAFMAYPVLVFLNEPTTGLDAVAKRKLWKVIRAARDVEIDMMKTGQFMCLRDFQDLRHRFGNSYAVKMKVADDDVETIKVDLISNLPGIEIHDQHNEMLFCNASFSYLPFSYLSLNNENQTILSFN
ncbi:unnamed protein product [Rotaria sordida]|uniref:ABC transporter domain-containing protein n=1 Tax=Rotaria sordida TaxID=392033 RepID=A0A813XBT4_9BILA|nr:unnamed protein product [Rotaria sordida]CAF0868340.1 unnamed protein product [Rotaria sordida]CAF3630598.1 unnamed protein product [Rotaria sordida]CAF3686730.1 unnamed protein product [Rotaria sordida]